MTVSTNNQGTLPHFENGRWICPDPVEHDIEWFDDDIADVPTIYTTIKNKLKKYSNELFNLCNDSTAFILYIKSIVPKESYKLILSNDDKMKLKSGALIFGKKGNSLIACLKDPVSGQIVKQCPVKKEMFSQGFCFIPATLSLMVYAQMRDISRSMVSIQHKLDAVLTDLSDQRFADSESICARFSQAQKVGVNSLKENLLITIISDAETVRNRLKKELSRNIKFISSQPVGNLSKLTRGATAAEIEQHIAIIRADFYAINHISLIEAQCYCELDEKEAMIESIDYYAQFISELFTSDTIERLHSFDGTGDDYWHTEIPYVLNKINTLSSLNLNTYIAEEP